MSRPGYCETAEDLAVRIAMMRDDLKNSTTFEELQAACWKWIQLEEKKLSLLGEAEKETGSRQKSLLAVSTLLRDLD